MRKNRKVHNDCPFDKETINMIKAEMYYVRSTNKNCSDTTPMTLLHGVNDFEDDQRGESSGAAYKEWLEKELEQL